MVRGEARETEAPHGAEPGQAVGWLPVAVLPLGMLAVRKLFSPWGFMWALAAAIYFGLKWLSWWKARHKVNHTALRSVAYLLAWPGMDALAFLDGNQRVSSPSRQDWFWGILKTSLGAVLFWGVARVVPSGVPLVRGWVGMIGLILFLHFGSFELIALGWRGLGINARPIMSSPLRSTSLSEFWGKRWNLGFRQLAHDLVFRPLHKTWGVGAAGFLVFLVSGLIHDLVISVPARGGYGLPTAYFALQGATVAIERTRLGKELGIRHGIRGWLLTALVTVGPAFWLFHPPFVSRVMIPFMEAVRAL